MMKAIVYNGENPTCIDVPIPRATKHKVLVKIHAAGVNPCDAKRMYGDKIPSKLWYISFVSELVGPKYHSRF